MTTLVIYSGSKNGPEVKKEFALRFDDHYASRFLRHLEDDPTLCTGCGKRCDRCRANYDLDMSGNVRTIQLPETLPYFIDNPDQYLPDKLPKHDVTIAINVHEDILLSLPNKAARAGARAFILPVENPDWITKWGRSRLKKLCKELGIEFSSPKPFCALEKGVGRFTDQFIDEFRIGRPHLNITLKNDTIEKAEVKICAPCGNTYFVAKNLIGKKFDEKINEWVAKYWHSYPCVASMKMDPELGDTILHKGGYIHYDAVHEALDKSAPNKAAPSH
jgi:hypothetical protein